MLKKKDSDEEIDFVAVCLRVQQKLAPILCKLLMLVLNFEVEHKGPASIIRVTFP